MPNFFKFPGLKPGAAERTASERRGTGRLGTSIVSKVSFLTALLFSAGISTLCAAEAPSLTPIPPTSFGVVLLRMIGSLAFVIGVVFAGAWLFRNFHRFRQQGSPTRKLQVLEARSLGPRQAIYVVGFEQQRLLIGSSAQGLTLLTHLPDGSAEPEPQRIVAAPFGEALMQALGRK